MYRRQLDGKTLEFDHCGYVYKGSFMMFDKQTESEWIHVTAECVMGPMKGKALDLVPTHLITWREWKALHPNTTVLADRHKWQERFLKGMDFASADSRPRLGVGVVVSHQSKLYPYTELESKQVINDDFQDIPLTVVFGPQAACAVAWVRKTDRKTLTFEATTGEDGRLLLKDKESGSTWDPLTGQALDGDLKGKELKPLVAIPIRMDRHRDFYPGAAVYGKPSPPRRRR